MNRSIETFLGGADPDTSATTPGADAIGAGATTVAFVAVDGLPPPPAEFLAERAREAESLARVTGQRPYDAKLHKWLHRISSPTLILWGEDDKIIPVQQAETWRRLVPNAEIRTYKGAGHLVHLEKPEAVEAVAKFLG